MADWLKPCQHICVALAAPHWTETTLDRSRCGEKATVCLCHGLEEQVLYFEIVLPGCSNLSANHQSWRSHNVWSSSEFGKFSTQHFGLCAFFFRNWSGRCKNMQTRWLFRSKLFHGFVIQISTIFRFQPFTTDSLF